MANGSKVPYPKPAKTVEEHVDLLKARGLVIPDEVRAKRYLRFVGYYRLAAYCKPYQVPGDVNHTFLPGSTFDNVLNLYIFDRQLRLLVMDAIERIEVAVRTVINDHMSLAHGPFWYLEPANFDLSGPAPYNHSGLIDIIKRETGAPGTKANSRGTQPPFCRHYFDTYSSPPLPPCWMVGEVLSLGTWSQIYDALPTTQDKKQIAKAFYVRSSLFSSWLHALTYTRNICAHHSLLWNRTFTIKPAMKNEYDGIPDHKLYAQALVIRKFLCGIVTHSTWHERLRCHFDDCPRSIAEMGFPANWWTSPIWTNP